jgi:hypothetical protein
MRTRLAAALAVLALSAAPAGAGTLGDLLRARGLTPPAGGLPGLDQTEQPGVLRQIFGAGLE